MNSLLRAVGGGFAPLLEDVLVSPAGLHSRLPSREDPASLFFVNPEVG